MCLRGRAPRSSPHLHPTQAFSNDPRQRQLVLPRALSARDRWRAHLLAEGWGLMHKSAGEGGARRLVVWKPSRTRRTLKPAMAQFSDSEGEGDSGEAGSGAADEAGGNATAAGEQGAASVGGGVEAAV